MIETTQPSAFWSVESGPQHQSLQLLAAQFESPIVILLERVVPRKSAVLDTNLRVREGD